MTRLVDKKFQRLSVGAIRPVTEEEEDKKEKGDDDEKIGNLRAIKYYTDACVHKMLP